MTQRRLAKVEAGLSPTALVLRWLAVAHAYDDFTIYTRSLVESEPPMFPLDQLVHEAEASARQLARGSPRDEGERTIRQAIFGTVFRFQLALRINVIAQEFLDREVLVQGVRSAYLALELTADERPKDRAMLPIPRIRDILFAPVAELHPLETARRQVESRYLGATHALFPAPLRAWDRQRHDSEREAVIADRLAELDGCEPAPPDDHEDVDARVAQLVADHVERAHSRAYDELGGGQRALRLAVGWMRPNLIRDDAR